MSQTVKKKPKTKASAKRPPAPDDDDEDVIRLVRLDDREVVVGGFASLDLVAWSDPVGVLACSVLHRTGVLELGAGTPVVRPLVEEWTQACGRARDGRWAMLHGLMKKTRPIRVYSASIDRDAALDLVPTRKAEFAAIGFVGARVVAIPGYLGTHRRSLYPRAQQPFLQEGTKLVPAPGLAPGDEGDAPQLTSVITCADGRDVLVWGGRMFELVLDRFTRTHGFDLQTTHSNVGLTAVTAGSTGFFTISDGRLVEILPGASKPRSILPKETFLSVRPGPGATMVLVASYASAQKSALWAYDPVTDNAMPVGSPKGVHPTPVFYAASRGALAMFATADSGTAGQVIVLTPSGR